MLKKMYCDLPWSCIIQLCAIGRRQTLSYVSIKRIAQVCPFLRLFECWLTCLSNDLRDFLFLFFCFRNTGRPLGLVKRGLNGVQGPQVGQPTSFIGNSTRTTNIALAPSTCNNSINHTICGHLIDAQIHARERTDTSHSHRKLTTGLYMSRPPTVFASALAISECTTAGYFIVSECVCLCVC